MQKPPAIPLLLERLETFARDVDEALSDPLVDWECAPAPEEWCLTEVVCHLRDVEKEVHQRRFRALIEEDEAFLPGVAADDWVEERAYREQHGPTAMKQFLDARQETLALLRDLDEPVWRRQGQHAFFGPTSLHELLNLAVQHDAAHWEQIDDLLVL